MAAIAQDILVGIIVVGCALFSAWRLMSPSLRLRALDRLGPVMGKLGAGSRIGRLRSNTLAQLSAGCSACSHHKATVHRPGGSRS